MTAFFLTDFMDIHIFLLFVQDMRIDILHGQTGKDSDSGFAGKDFYDRSSRYCIGDHDWKHLIRSREIHSDQSSHSKHAPGKKAGGCCRESTLRDHTKKSSPYRSEFSCRADFIARNRTCFVLQPFHKQVCEKKKRQQFYTVDHGI